MLEASQKLCALEAELVKEAVAIAGEEYYTHYHVTFDGRCNIEMQMENTGEVSEACVEVIVCKAEHMLKEAEAVAAAEAPPTLPFERKKKRSEEQEEEEEEEEEADDDDEA